MSIKFNTVVRSISSGCLTYLIITSLTTTVWYLLVTQVLIKLSSIPLEMRRYYDNFFVDLLTLIGVFLFLSYVLYGMIRFLFLNFSASWRSRIVIGVFAGVIPAYILHATTYGIDLSDPAILSEFLILAIAGGSFPVVYQSIYSFLARSG